MIQDWNDLNDPLLALQRGDPTAFEAFVSSEQATFQRFFIRLGADLEEAEDLTQDLFMKLYRSAGNYQARERFAAFGFRVARNAWIDRQRKRAARPQGQAVAQDADEEPLALAVDPQPGAPGQLDQRERAERLHWALARLPEHHRLVFELGALQELSYEEVARVLKIPEGTVKSRMFHAVAKLRQALKSLGSEA